MAKISANGNHKVAQANKEWRDDDGYDHKVILALRSDGAILRKHSLRSPTMRESYGARGWNEGGYSIAGRILALTGSPRLVRAFVNYAIRHGYEVKP